jgi:polyferredoxin
MAAQPTVADSPRANTKKVLTRRAARDRSQAWRKAVQYAFLALNIWIGVEFYLFVRFYESGGATLYADRPPGVEGWLPIAALMNLKVLAATRHIPHVHPAGMFLLLAFLAISLLIRKAFCGWLCPVGTVSEALWKLGRRLFKRNSRLPRWADLPLRSLKYALLALFLYAVGSMPVGAIEAFLGGPYGTVADVRMLNFFRTLGVAGTTTLLLLGLASLFVQNFWCRYLCPYGALMGLVSLASPARIRREKSACIDCARCAKACPSLLPVDRLVTVHSAECMACLECVAACPAEGALALTVAARRRMPAWAVAAGVAALFAGVVAYAQWTGSWRTERPSQTYFDLVPRAQEFTHP